MRRLLIVPVAVFVAILAGASPAAANSTERDVINFDIVHPVDFCPFPLEMAEVGTFKAIHYFDNDGAIVQTIVTAFGQLTLTITNPANGKSTVTQNESQVIRITYNDDGSREFRYSTGVTFAFTMPGHGRILSQVGRYVVEGPGHLVFVAGQAQLIEGDFAAICAALS